MKRTLILEKRRAISGDYQVVSKASHHLFPHYKKAIESSKLIIDNYAVEGYDMTLGTSP
jgi:hypothetical protein